MRVLVLGGTRFIGRAVVDALAARGHVVAVCHRGETEPEGLPDVPHLHAARHELAARRPAVEAFGPDAAVDCLAMSKEDASSVLGALAGMDLRWVVLSSQDIYRAFHTLQAGGRATDPVPLTEDSPLRSDPPVDVRGVAGYSKRAVEAVYAGAGGVALRLPMTYGCHDYQRREEPVLRRVRAGRDRIPVGPADGLLPYGLVSDVATGVALAVETEGIEGQAFNLCEAAVDTVGLRFARILAAAGSSATLVTVPAPAIPPDLELTGSLGQPIVVSSAKARSVLGYRDTPVDEAVAVSVRWHLDHPPPREDPDFGPDDAALAAAGG